MLGSSVRTYILFCRHPRHPSHLNISVLAKKHRLNDLFTILPQGCEEVVREAGIGGEELSRVNKYIITLSNREQKMIHYQRNSIKTAMHSTPYCNISNIAPVITLVFR